MKSNALRTNEQALVAMAVQGKVVPPRFFGWEVTHDGRPLVLPSVGGIVYNVKVGDSVYAMVADHVEPGVSASASTEKPKADPNRGFNVYSCVGNEVSVVSGNAKGGKGVVTGHHGGVEHVIIDFPDSVLEKMTHEDRLLIRAEGFGLALLDFPDIACYGLSARLLKAMHIDVGHQVLNVPVAAVVPAHLMGSGLGTDRPFQGDYDIQTSDQKALRETGLGDLRLGDLVAITDHQARWGYAYRRGACTVGVVVHGDSYLAGHGPGVQVLMTTDKRGLIEPKIDPDANIGRYLKIGRYRGNK